MFILTLQLPETESWDAVTMRPEDVRETDIPASGRTVSGYGRRIPTKYLIRHGGRWYRVRIMSYANSGSAYVTIGGRVASVESY